MSRIKPTAAPTSPPEVPVLDPIDQLGDVVQPDYEDDVAGIDAVYVINMDAATDRMQHVARELRREGMAATRMPAVDGRKVGLIKARVKNGDVHPISAHLCAPGALGCALSHLDLWRICAARDHHATLVLEDDVVLAGGFWKKATRALRYAPDDFDILLLGYIPADETATAGLMIPATGPTRQVNRHIVDPALFYGTHCYIISKEGARKLATSWQVVFQVDIQLATDSRAKVYATSYMLAAQRSASSYVRPMHFPRLCNTVWWEMPGLNLYGRSIIHPVLWTVIFGMLGVYKIYPPAVGAIFLFELYYGMSSWWAACLVVWLAGLTLLPKP